MTFTLKDTNNKIREVKVTPETITNEEGNKSYVVGISLDNTVNMALQMLYLMLEILP